MTGQGPGPFDAAALEVNRAGRLTDAQRQSLGRRAGAWRRNELVGAVMSVIVGIVVLTAAGPASGAPVRLAGGIALIALGAFFLYRSLPGGDPLTRDVRTGSVMAVEGAFEKRVLNSSGRSSSTSYSMSLAGKTFDVSSAVYHAAPEAGIVRLFYLPTSRTVVNLEPLPDRPLPAGALDAPMQAIASVMAGLRSHDATQRADAKATMAAMEHAFQGGQTRGVMPPPDQRDSRPLADAILGSWRMGPMTITFAADGTAVAGAAGRAEHGHWSVDADGRLRFSAGGAEQVADAWIAGDTLTIAEAGVGRSFQRIAGA